MSDTPRPNGLSHPLRIADLPNKKPTRFDLSLQKPELAALAGEIDILSIRKLRFHGSLIPTGRRDWHLEGTIGATVVQPCVVSLEPVTTRIDDSVARIYLADPEDADQDDETVLDELSEPLPDVVDIAEIMVEALVLRLPLYPRAKGAILGEAIFTKPGAQPMSDQDARPFAGLKSLRDKLEKDSD